MQCYIKDFKTFETLYLFDTSEYALPCGENGQVVIYQKDAVKLSQQYSGNWLIANHEIFYISQASPRDNNAIELTIKDPIYAFDRPAPISTLVASTYQELISGIFDINYGMNCPDAQYIIGYLEITTSGSMPCDIEPDEYGYVIPYEVFESALSHNVRIQFQYSNESLLVDISTAVYEYGVIVFNDGHTTLKEESYDPNFVSKITVLHDLPQENPEDDPAFEEINYYLADDGEVYLNPPENRAEGVWKYYTATQDEDPDEIAVSVFEDNNENHKIEFYSEKRFELYQPIRMRLRGEEFKTRITSRVLSNTDSRYYYKCGNLSTTLLEKIQDMVSPTSYGSHGGSGGGSSGGVSWDQVNELISAITPEKIHAARETDIPYSTLDLLNEGDKEHPEKGKYLTAADITKTSDLINDGNGEGKPFITEDDIPEISENVSAFLNDEKYLSALNEDQTVLNSGDDLNTITDPGEYRIANGTVARSLLNKPDRLNNSGRLIVLLGGYLSPTTNEHLRTQIIIGMGDTANTYWFTRNGYPVLSEINGETVVEWRWLPWNGCMAPINAYRVGTEIKARDDLNNLLTPGEYYIPDEDTADDVLCGGANTHIPYRDGSSRLLVFRSGKKNASTTDETVSSTFVSQILYGTGSYDLPIYMRQHDATGWYKWRKLLNSVLTVDAQGNMTEGASYPPANSTPATDTNDKSLATTEFVRNAIDQYAPSGGGGGGTDTNAPLHLKRTGSEISSGKNLNTYVIPGEYYIASGTIASNITNCPFTAGNSRLFVFQGGAVWRRAQLLIGAGNSSGMYIRSMTQDLSTEARADTNNNAIAVPWSEWLGVDGSNPEYSAVFIATYNTTSFDEISAAFNNGKVCLANSGTQYYMLTHYSTTDIWFELTDYANIRQLHCYKSNGNTVWVARTKNLKLGNFVNDMSNTSGDTQRITNVADPVNDQDAATKFYVDSKPSVFVATYNSTSFADISNAYNACKVCIVRYNYDVYILSYITSTNIWFECTTNKGVKQLHVTASGWSTRNATFLKTSEPIETVGVSSTTSEVNLDTYTTPGEYTINNTNEAIYYTGYEIDGRDKNPRKKLIPTQRGKARLIVFNDSGYTKQLLMGEIKAVHEENASVGDTTRSKIYIRSKATNALAWGEWSEMMSKEDLYSQISNVEHSDLDPWHWYGPKINKKANSLILSNLSSFRYGFRMPADENLRPAGFNVEEFLKWAAIHKSVYAGYYPNADINGTHDQNLKQGTVFTYLSDGYAIPLFYIDPSDGSYKNIIRSDGTTPVSKFRSHTTMCSDFVINVLYQCGYRITDPTYAPNDGDRSLGPSNKYYNQYVYQYKNLPDYLERQGWRIITRIDDLLPGDIVFTKFNKGSVDDSHRRFNPGHVFIYVGPVLNGKVYDWTQNDKITLNGVYDSQSSTYVHSRIPLAYDCGNTTAVRNYDSSVEGTPYWKGLNYLGGLNECYFGVNDSDTEDFQMREPTDLWDPTIYGFLGEAYDPVSEANPQIETNKTFELYGWRGENTSYYGKPLFRAIIPDQHMDIDDDGDNYYDSVSPKNAGWYVFNDKPPATAVWNGLTANYTLSSDISTCAMTKVTSPSGNPKTKKYYELSSDGNSYFKTTDEAVQSGKNYYSRGARSTKIYYQRVDPVGLLAEMYNPKTQKYVDWITENDKTVPPIRRNTGKLGLYNYTQSKMEYPIIAIKKSEKYGWTVVAKLHKDGEIEIKIVGTTLKTALASGTAIHIISLTKYFGADAGNVRQNRPDLTEPYIPVTIGEYDATTEDWNPGNATITADDYDDASPKANGWYYYLTQNGLKKLTPSTVYSTHPYSEVSSPSGNPKTKGYYVISNSKLVKTTDTSVVSGKTYYIREERLRDTQYFMANPNTSINVAFDSYVLISNKKHIARMYINSSNNVIMVPVSAVAATTAENDLRIRVDFTTFKT